MSRRKINEAGYRRIPTQARAKDTVDSIVAATHQLILAKGFSEVGSNEIAARAGVSIGSFYQYFATSDSVLIKLFEESSSRAAAEMQRLAHRNSVDLSFDKLVEKGLNRILTLHERDRLILVDLVVCPSGVAHQIC